MWLPPVTIDSLFAGDRWAEGDGSAASELVNDMMTWRTASGVREEGHSATEGDRARAKRSPLDQKLVLSCAWMHWHVGSKHDVACGWSMDNRTLWWVHWLMLGG